MISMNGQAEELYTLNQSAVHNADRKYIPRKPVKMKSAPTIPHQFRSLLDIRAYLFVTTIDASPLRYCCLSQNP